MVILDLDGTLYCKRGLAFRIVMHNLLEISLISKERAVRKDLKGKWFGSEQAFYDTFYAEMANSRMGSVDFMRWWHDTCYMPLMVKLLRLYYSPNKWVIPFLKQCREKGLQLVLLSDYDFTDEKLAALGIDRDLFDWVVSAPELGGLKPAPQLMDVITGHMQVEPSQCTIIGDRKDTDGALALSSGAQFIHVK